MSGLVEAKDIPWAAWRLARKTLFSVLSRLPIRAHMEIAVMRGRIFAPVLGIPTHVRDNIEVALGDNLVSSEIKRIARHHLQYIKRAYLADFLPLLPDFKNPRRWDVEGLEHLDDALVRKHGVILTTAHLGYPRLIAPILRASGYDVVQIVDGGASRSG